MGSYKWCFKSPNIGFIGFLGFSGSYKWCFKSPNMGCNYRYPDYNPTSNYP